MKYCIQGLFFIQFNLHKRMHYFYVTVEYYRDIEDRELFQEKT